MPTVSSLQVSMPAAHATSSAPTVTLVQLPNGQTVQVHGVIQAAQPSVIQSPQVQTVQVLTEENSCYVNWALLNSPASSLVSNVFVSWIVFLLI